MKKPLRDAAWPPRTCKNQVRQYQTPKQGISMQIQHVFTEIWDLGIRGGSGVEKNTKIFSREGVETHQV